MVFVVKDQLAQKTNLGTVNHVYVSQDMLKIQPLKSAKKLLNQNQFHNALTTVALTASSVFVIQDSLNSNLEFVLLAHL
jgi:hypothetical protein